MRGKWIEGNAIRLLENGEEFFPCVFERIASAKHEVILETFILFEDKVGLRLHEALVAAALRGVQVDVTIDGFGSPDLSTEFISTLCKAGVRLHVFEPAKTVFGARVSLLRRMHRKIVVVDNEVAFVGGINYSADHLGDFGPEAKQDYSVEIRGPLVAEIHRFTHGALASGMRYQRQRKWWRNRKQLRAFPDHSYLTKSGVKVYEYTDRPLHGKVAVADDEWATVGSSNLDPLSLALNLEANVVIRDRGFNQQLAGRLEQLIRDSCTQIQHEGKLSGWKLIRSYLAFHIIRRYHRWALWLPRHMPMLHPASIDELAAATSRSSSPRSAQ